MYKVLVLEWLAALVFLHIWLKSAFVKCKVAVFGDFEAMACPAIHSIYAPIEKLGNDKIKYPHLRSPQNIEKRWTLSFSMFPLLIKKTPETNLSKLTEAVAAVIMFEGIIPNGQVVYYLLSLNHVSNILLLTKNHEQQPTELLRFKISSIPNLYPN